ncbi:hypothetical protein ACUXV3_00390 [Roseobacteraceae bacterium NS-SX3]
MQVIIHCGAHATEEDRLLKSLLRNTDILAPRGTAVPGPGKYRTLLKDCMAALGTGAAAANSRDVLWDAILDGGRADRVVLSNPHFFGSQRVAVEGNQLYPEAEMRIRALQQLFPHDQLELFMAVRNPAGFLPAVLENAAGQRVRQVLDTTDPLQLHWSDLMARLRAAAPGVAITAWCYEDMPLIWGQLVRDMGGLEMQERIQGGMDLLGAIMTREGMRRLRDYLHKHQEMTEVHKRRVYAAFLDKFAREEELEEELDLPGWTEELVEAVTESYEEDVYHLQRIPGVTLIAP